MEKRYGQAATACLGRIDAHREQLPDVCATPVLDSSNRSFRNHSCMPRMGDWYFQLPGNPYEIGQRGGFHLLHNLAAVDLKRHLADSEFRGGLLVEQATS